MIKCENLNIGYDRELLSRPLHLELEAKTYVLLGKNGCGKSTFLKTLGGLLNPKSGRVVYPEGFKLSEDISFVLTDQIDIPYLTVLELVRLGRYPFANFWGELNQQDESIIDETLEMLLLTHVRHDIFSKLSDGLKQRVLLARALAKRPKLLLLDEPFSYLDPPSKLRLVKLLKEIEKVYKPTLIFSTHDWELISEFYQNVFFIDQKNQFVSTTISEISHQNLLSEIFDLGHDIIQDKSKLIIKDF